MPVMVMVGAGGVTILGCTIEAFHRSRCPDENCFGPILKECGSAEGKIVEKTGCPKCRKPFCFRFEIAWEPNHRCEERAMDALFQRLMIRKRWKTCPACGCEASFCYSCGRRDAGCTHYACPYNLDQPQRFM